MDKYNEAIAKFDTNIDDERVKYEVEKILDEHYKENCTREVYSFILSCLDLTSLNITDNDETITAFVSKVNDFENTCPDMNPVAAICVYPNFVTTVRAALDVSSVKIASVAGGFPSAQTYSELKTVENPKGTLVMGTNCEFEPFEYLTSDGTPTGFDVDYVKYLCAEMGYEVTIENMDFDALIPALQSGRIDFIAAGLTRNEEREQNANFTDGYYEAVQSIVVAIPEA